MKLYGKKLDIELAKRRQTREERIDQRLTLRNAAKQRNIKVTDLIAYENGEDVCSHKKWEDMSGGVPIPKFIFKRCKKCGKINEKSMEKISAANMKRAYKVFNKCTKVLPVSKKK